MTADAMTADTAALAQPRGPGRVARVLRRAARDLAYLTLGALTATLGFVILVAGLSLTLSLIVFIVGLWVALATAFAFRLPADLDRRLQRLAGGEELERRYRPRPPGSSWYDLVVVRAVLGDPQTWRDLAWLVVHSILGFTFGVFAVSAVGWIVGTIALPAWWFFLPESDPITFGIFDVTSAGYALLGSAIALAAIPVLVALMRGMTLIDSSIARGLLSPLSRRQLEQRVEHLAETRAGLADVNRADLERIERDLHDGAQARIVALAMELGMAEETVGRDPEAAREMVERARAEALTALAELRDLARGMRPAVLAERGLAEAVEALAARVPLRTGTRIRGELGGLPRPVETASYFVVAEALANASKHSGAEAVGVSLCRDGGRLRIEVRDDGRGGADPDGSGIAGLRARVSALDGELRVESPAGGPTVIRAELPCG